MNDPLYNNLAWGPCKGKEGQGIGRVDEVGRTFICVVISYCHLLVLFLSLS